MKIFVTGGTGFIGSHLIRKALIDGHEMICLTRSKRQTKIKLPSEPTWIKGNLESDIRYALEGCNAIIHLASYGVDPDFDSWIEAYRWNVVASKNIWNQAKDSGIERFIIAGSCSEYGRTAESFENIPPNAPLDPVDVYGASKAAASITATTFSRMNNLELAVLRPFHVFGDGENQKRLWPSLKKAALNGKDFPMTLGEQIRDFTPVELVAEKFIFFATQAKLKKGIPQVHNLGTGKPMTVKKFTEYHWDKLGAKGSLKPGKIPYRKNEVMRYVPLI